MPKKSRVRLVEYDYSQLLDAAVGAAGVPERELPEIFEAAERVRQRLLEVVVGDRSGFFRIPSMSSELREALRLAVDLRREFRRLIVVGIGGSDLGTRAVLRALGPSKGMAISFIGANTDPEEIAELLKNVDWRHTAINVISKSGDTMEPLATFLLLRQRLIKSVGRKQHVRHVVISTDAERGALRQVVRQEGYRSLATPSDVGGRFSALTPTGLFPLACAGLPVRRLLVGAAAVLSDLRELPAAEQPALLLAAFHHHAYVRRGCVMSVLMPYAEALRGLGDWYRQLWAESLGKRVDRSGRVTHQGLTPIVALGATDQHSQTQLYNEGPNDKLTTFVAVRRFRDDFTVPKSYADIDGLSYLGGHRFSKLIDVERQATAWALTSAGRPNGTLHLRAVDPESVGAFMFTWQVATVALAELMNVDAYDQPGVEAGKLAMFALLGRPGYRKHRPTRPRAA